MSLDLLAFAAHPDDAEFGCAGVLIQASDQGLSVGVADITEGEKSTRGSPELRLEEKDAASKVLGLSDRLSLGLPDSEIGASPDHLALMVEMIRRTRPKIVLAPYWQDRHPDHAAAGSLVQRACFYAGVAKFGEGEPHRPFRLFHYMLHHPFQPSFVVDISRVWQRKLDAIGAYRSQFAGEEPGPLTPISDPRFLEWMDARAVWFGAMIGASRGEPFISIGPVGFTQLPGLESLARADDLRLRYSMY